MSIKKVTCHVVAAPVQRPFTSSRGWLYKTRGTCLVEIETDDGVVGWGECYGPSAVAKTFIETQLAARVIGRDPFDVEVIWEDLYNRIKDYGPKGMSIAAISGIDIALWDIVGKYCGKPVHKMIGGAFRTEVNAYATGLYFTDMDRLVDEAVEEAEGYVKAGFKAIKMKIGLGSVKRDYERVQAVRKAIGNDIKLMVDANHCFSVPAAIRLGRQLEELDIEWFEEPISPEDIDGYVEVSRALDMAVAGGENEFTRWGFRDAIVRKAMDIVQPDVCAAGGITECKKIAALASVHGVRMRAACLGLRGRSGGNDSFPRRDSKSAAELVSDAADARVRAGRKPVPRSSGGRADRAEQGHRGGAQRGRSRHRSRSQGDRPISRFLIRTA